MPWTAEGLRGLLARHRVVVERRDPSSGVWSRVTAPTTLEEAQARMDEELAWRPSDVELRIRRDQPKWVRWAVIGSSALLVAVLLFLVWS